MGFGGISIWSLLLILAIVVLLFGTKKLRNVGTDLGGAIRSFKKAVKEEDDKTGKGGADTDNVIEGKVSSEDKEKV
jgi:sec-independent protein translocase protein TatA